VLSVARSVWICMTLFLLIYIYWHKHVIFNLVFFL
jgi:hypothetical protein